MGEIIFGWVFLSFLCGLVLSGKNTGFWGTFFLCLFLSPLLGVIISATSGNKEIRQTKKESKSVEKEKLLKQIENLKKEEELDLISEEGKIKLDELTAVYKNYDEWYNSQKKNRVIERKEKSQQDWFGRNVIKIILVYFIVMLIVSFFLF